MELLHFTANWCKPCEKMQPIIEQFLLDNPDIIYKKIDVDHNPDPVKMNNVMSVPTFIVKKNAEESKRHSGIATLEEINTWFN